MPLKSEFQQIHEAVGELALDYERQYPSALDRTARVCPWLRSVDPELFFSLVPYHKDARTVIARERGFRDWSELAAKYDEPDGSLYSDLEVNQRCALGFEEEFSFSDDENSESLIGSCILWLTLARRFDRVEPLCHAAGPAVWSQSPSLLRRLIEADAPFEVINFCLKSVKAVDWGASAVFAFRLGQDETIEAMRGVDSLPALSDLDMLLEACSKLDEEEIEAWLFRSPHLWTENRTEVWRTVSHWASVGRADAIELARKWGLRHPGAENYWCSPLHHAAWGSDLDGLKASFALGCPIHVQDRKYLSTPFGWLIRSHSLTPNGISPFPQGDPLEAGRLLLARGAIVMPSHLFCPNKDLLDRLIS
jgi:hypothetical protein